MPQPQKPFLETLYHLRTLEQVILYNKIAAIPAGEEKETLDFLEAEYEREAVNYPFIAPPFNKAAAIWGAKTMYFASQLMLYREDAATQLVIILPVYEGEVNASAQLSADVCLRFLPQILQKLVLIDTEDPLITIVKERLLQFHYSGVGAAIDITGIDVAPLFTNDCFRQLYLNRVIAHKALNFASLPLVKQGVLESLGNHKNVFWKEIAFEEIIQTQ